MTGVELEKMVEMRDLWQEQIKEKVIKEFLEYAADKEWVLCDGGDNSITDHEKEKLIKEFLGHRQIRGKLERCGVSNAEEIQKNPKVNNKNREV